MNVAIIPARGGSKRIPRKNTLEFAGKPMIAHSIDCAMLSGLFHRVIVSTDDEEVARIARNYGAEVPFIRPAQLANDHAGTMEVIAHAVDWLRANQLDVEMVCCIYATAPFMRRQDLANGLEMLRSGAWQYAFAATTFAYPIFRSFRKLAAGGIEMIFPEHQNTRSQDLPDALHDAGQFYWGRAEAWQNHCKILDQNSAVVMIPSWRVHDLDTPEDWKRAEIAWRVIERVDDDA